MKINKKTIASAIATGALLINSVSPALAATTIDITGSGSSSFNNATITHDQSITVAQDNNTNITNNVIVTARTGQNNISGNDRSNAVVVTGDALSRVDLSNSANLNMANVADQSIMGNSRANINNNEFGSVNTASFQMNDLSSLMQNNVSDLNNIVSIDQNTGFNEVSGNQNSLESGNMATIITGSSVADMTARNAANGNAASMERLTGGSLTANMSGNDSSSMNSFDVFHDQNVDLFQDNIASIMNLFDAVQNTGSNMIVGNDARSIKIDTGKAQSQMEIENESGFNTAMIGNDMLNTVMSTIAGNEFESASNVSESLNRNLSVMQGTGSLASLTNLLSMTPDTGSNIVAGNSSNDNVVVFTGLVSTDTSIKNTGSANTLGPSITLPNGTSLDFSFNLNDLFDLLGR